MCTREAGGSAEIAPRGRVVASRDPQPHYARSLGPREREVLRLMEERPGITVAELADALGFGMARAWQIFDRLEASRAFGTSREHHPAEIA